MKIGIVVLSLYILSNISFAASFDEMARESNQQAAQETKKTSAQIESSRAQRIAQAEGETSEAKEVVCNVNASQPFHVWEVYLSVSGKPTSFELDSGLTIVDTGKQSKQLKIRLIPQQENNKTLAETRVFRLLSQKDHNVILKDILVNQKLQPGWLRLGRWQPTLGSDVKFKAEGPQLDLLPKAQIKFSSKLGGSHREKLAVGCEVK